MQSAVQYLQNTGHVISEADLERLSPVRYEHINVFGKYSFDRPGDLPTDQLRPENVGFGNYCLSCMTLTDYQIYKHTCYELFRLHEQIILPG